MERSGRDFGGGLRASSSWPVLSIGTRRLRVVHAVPDLLFGGLQRLVVQLAEGLPPARFETHVLVFGAVGPLAGRLPGATTLHQLSPQEPWSLAWPRRLAAQFRSIAPDVVHSHSGVWYKAARAAKKAGVPLVVHTDHGRMHPDPWQARLMDYLGSRHTDVVVGVSAPLCDKLGRLVAHPDRLRLVINGVDTTALRPGAPSGVRTELGIDSATTVIGSIGRLEAIKGYDVMIDSFADLVRRIGARPTVLVIAGDGSERRGLEDRVRSYGLADRVFFLGWRSDIAELLAAFDLFVLTSRSEGTSVSLLEAMSAGVCPVVTRVGGNPDVLGSELAHRLVPPENPGTIATGWLDALDQSEMMARDATAARARVVERFSLRAMVGEYARIYSAGGA